METDKIFHAHCQSIIRELPGANCIETVFGKILNRGSSTSVQFLGNFGTITSWRRGREER